MAILLWQGLRFEKSKLFLYFFVDFLDDDEVAFGSTEFIVMRAKEGITDSQYIY